MEKLKIIDPWRKFTTSVKKEATELISKVSVRDVIEKLESLKLEISQSKKADRFRQYQRDVYTCVLFGFIKNHQKHPVAEIDWNRFRLGEITIDRGVNKITPSQALFQNIREVVPSRFTREFLVHTMHAEFLPKHHAYSMLQIARKKNYLYEISVLEKIVFSEIHQAA